jgi:1-phosphatidylinositol-3-phosphate 5-kinase
VKYPPPFLLLRLCQQEDLKQPFNDHHRNSLQLIDDGHESPIPEELANEQSSQSSSSAESRSDMAFIDRAHNLSPFDHQNIMFLFSNMCLETLMPCQPPEIHVIDFYRSTDMTIGQYLEELCTNARMLCPLKECNRAMLKHFRSYAHGNGRTNVIVEEFDSGQDGIWMWNYCKICKTRTPEIRMSDVSRPYYRFTVIVGIYIIILL